jgi:hypothetical protein
LVQRDGLVGHIIRYQSLGSAMPPLFSPDSNDPIFAAAAETSTSGVVTDDELIVLIEARRLRDGQPRLEISRALLNERLGPFKRSDVSKWPEHGIYRNCLVATREWRCEYLVFSTTSEREAAALRFAVTDPPFIGAKAFAAGGSGSRQPPSAPRKRPPHRPRGASGFTPNEKRRANLVSPGARNDEEDGNDDATLICGPRDWRDACAALRAATDAARAAADAERAGIDANRAAAHAELGAIKFELLNARRAVDSVTRELEAALEKARAATCERDAARAKAREKAREAQKLGARLRTAHGQSQKHMRAGGDAGFMENKVCSLEEELEECRAELTAALVETAAFKEPRVMQRERQGRSFEYSLVVREFAIRAMAIGASSAQVVMFWRVAHLFFVPWLVEGKDYEVPRISYMDESRRAIPPLTSIIRAKELSDLETHGQICHDETGLDRTSFQAEVVVTDTGRSITRVHQQAGHSASEAAGGVQRGYEEDALYLEIFRDELGDDAAGSSSTPNVLCMSQIKSTMNDTTNGALLAAKKIGELALAAKKEQYTDAQWAALPEFEKVVYNWPCLNHVVCLPIVEYLRLEAGLNKSQDDITESLSTSAWRERMGDIGLDEFMRAVLKLFSTQGASGIYGKGDRERFLAFMRDKHPDEVWVSMGRGELGSRFLWVLEAAFGAHHNFEVGMIEYLTACLATEANVLRDSVYVKSTSVFMMAKLRCAAIMFDKLFKPLRALINSKALDNDPCQMAPILDHVRHVARRLADPACDPAFFLHAEYRVFEDMPGLDEWEAHELERLERSVGGNGVEKSGPGAKVKMVRTLVQIRARLYPGNDDADRPAMLRHLTSHFRIWGEGIVKSLERSVPDFLSPSGKYCAARQDPHMTAASKKCGCVDDPAERAFAVLKHFKKRFPSACADTLCGLVAAHLNGSLSLLPAPMCYESKKRVLKRRAEAAKSDGRLTLDTMPEAEKNAALRAALNKAFVLSKKLAREKLVAAYKHQAEKHEADVLHKEASAKAKYQEAVAVYANHPWLATHAALLEKVGALLGKVAALDAGLSPATDEVMAGQIRIALAYGWAPALKERDSTLDLRTGQGCNGVEKLRAALWVTMQKLYAAATADPPLVAPEKPKPPKSIYREVLRLGEVTKRREVFLKECVDKSEEMARLADRTDDSEMAALHEFFLLPAPTQFYDREAGEDRVAVDVVFQKGTGFFLETARLDRAGTGSIEHGALYSLDAKGKEGIGRMIAAFKLRDARRAAAAAGSGRGGALRDAAVAPRAAVADAAGPPAAAAPSRRQPTRRARTAPVDDMFVFG